MSIPRVEPSLDDQVSLVLEDLLRPSAYPHPTMSLEVRETHLSWVILTGCFAYKIKKPVTLSFIDQGTLERRRVLCEEELRLNRRLAADLYEAIVPITVDPDGLRIEGHGPIVEYAVKMKQFSQQEELSALLEQQRVTAAEIRALGTRMAEFHDTLPKSSDSAEFPATRHLHDAVLGSLATVLCHLVGDSCHAEMGKLVDWIHDYCHESLFQLRRREQGGHIRECHGDLHVRNIVRWNGQLVPFDSLEFDPKLRWIDTMNDVAFLFIDLLSHNRPDLAYDFLNAYLSRSGDYTGVRVLRFYAIYRSLVRAMVDSFAADTCAAKEQYRERLRTRLRTAANLLKLPSPALIIMHGLSGSGKSWMSARLAEQVGAVQIRSDVERKRLQAATGARSIHTPEFNERTYSQLLARAESCLQGGMTTILDAAFLQSSTRDHFKSWADRHGVLFLIVSCRAELPELEARINRRQETANDPSDADLPEVRRQVAHWLPLRESNASYLLSIDTQSEDAVCSVVTQVRQRVEASGAGRVSATRAAEC